MFHYEKKEIITDNNLSDEEWQKVLERYIWHLEEEDYKVFEIPTIPAFVDSYLKWSLDEGRNLAGVLSYFQSEYPKKSIEIEIYMMNSETQNKVAVAYLSNKWKIKEQKLYARILHADLLSDEDDGFWNLKNGELSIGDKWHDNSGYKTTLLTEKEWNSLGINKDNAIFVKGE